ncbi:MAG TPA: DUF4105 domain-containing protein [Polyangia bacterium]|jgi:hypothetical protein|nr:DUF4105 domain-containing protein [Polyangia bacterium]
MFLPAAAMHALIAAVVVVSDPPATDDSEGQRLLAAAHAGNLAASRGWQVLLHYRRTAFGGWRSEADGAGFFLAGPRGRHDPGAELDATLAALLSPAPSGDDHPQCRFPARWAWLKAVLPIDPARVPDQVCPAFATWRTGMSAQAVTLIYATAYLNSPASMYGHTFLRLSRATGEGNPLLDYAVNFAADVDTDNGFLYALKGTAGLFPGRFYVMPYYVKVQEYSNMESRDLWEYPLTLSPAQVQRLVMHAWETRSTYFDYYFFTRNCSYQLLTLLEAADPSLHLIDQFGGTVIPSDTVRAVLAQPNLVRGRVGRPSLLSVMRSRRESLNAAEIGAAEAWALADPTDPAPAAAVAPLPRPRQAAVIDAAYDYLRFREGLHAEPSDGFKKRERRMLLARGRLELPPQDLVARPDIDAPETGHTTVRLGLGSGVSDHAGGFETLTIRAAIHDYLDPMRGYPADARLQMGDLRLRFSNRDRAVRLDRLDAVDIVSAAPFDRWVRGASWKVWMGADNAREQGCERPGSPHAGWRCLYGGLTTGGGVAARFGQRRILLLLLAETDLGVGPAFSDAHNVRAGLGGEALLAGGAGERWRFELGARGIYYPLGARGTVLRTRVAQSLALSSRFSLRAGVETSGNYAQAGGELVTYF